MTEVAILAVKGAGRKVEVSMEGWQSVRQAWWQCGRQVDLGIQQQLAQRQEERERPRGRHAWEKSGCVAAPPHTFHAPPPAGVGGRGRPVNGYDEWPERVVDRGECQR